MGGKIVVASSATNISWARRLWNRTHSREARAVDFAPRTMCQHSPANVEPRNYGFWVPPEGGKTVRVMPFTWRDLYHEIVPIHLVESEEIKYKFTTALISLGFMGGWIGGAYYLAYGNRYSNNPVVNELLIVGSGILGGGVGALAGWMMGQVLFLPAKFIVAGYKRIKFPFDYLHLRYFISEETSRINAKEAGRTFKVLGRISRFDLIEGYLRHLEAVKLQLLDDLPSSWDYYTTIPLRAIVGLQFASTPLPATVTIAALICRYLPKSIPATGHWERVGRLERREVSPKYVEDTPAKHVENDFRLAGDIINSHPRAKRSEILAELAKLDGILAGAVRPFVTI